MRVPHSGNKCSGLCETPCPHDDCWQCVKENAGAADRLAATRLLKGVAPGVSKEEQAREIAKLREAIGLAEKKEAAAAKANELQSEWDRIVQEKIQKSLEDTLLKGQPMLSSGAVPRYPNRPLRPLFSPWSDPNVTQIARPVLEELAKRAGIEMDWNNGDPVFTDRNRQFMGPDDVKASRGGNTIARILREIREGKNDTAKRALNAKGATDGDIAAVERLLGFEEEDPIINPDQVQTMTQLQTYLRQLGVELRSVSGLNDLLISTAEE